MLIVDKLFIIILLFLLIMNLYLLYLRKNLKKIKNENGLTGFEVAKNISEKLSTLEPHIIKKNGLFLDYYDLNRNIIKLTPEVFDNSDMFSVLTAVITAFEVKNENELNVKGHNFSKFMVMLSYAIIMLGALLNNFNIIYFGFVVFIIAFFLELWLFKKILEIKEDIIELLEEENINLKDSAKYFLTILLLIHLIRLPYSFIQNFR